MNPKMQGAQTDNPSDFFPLWNSALLPPSQTDKSSACSVASFSSQLANCRCSLSSTPNTTVNVNDFFMDELKERVLREMAELERDDTVSAEERDVKMAQYLRSLDKIAASEQRRLNAREQQQRQSPTMHHSAQERTASTSTSTAPTQRSTEDVRKNGTSSSHRSCVIL